jgi:hypothetical protein
VRRGRPFGRASAVGWKRNKFILYPVEFLCGVGIVAMMAVTGLVKSVTLLPDWQRYKKIRNI